MLFWPWPNFLDLDLYKQICQRVKTWYTIIGVSWFVWMSFLHRQHSMTFYDSGLYYPDTQATSDCWLRSGFKSPWRQLVLSLFHDHISYWRFTRAKSYMNVPRLDLGLIDDIQFCFYNYFMLLVFRMRLETKALDASLEATVWSSYLYSGLIDNTLFFFLQLFHVTSLSDEISNQGPWRFSWGNSMNFPLWSIEFQFSFSFFLMWLLMLVWLCNHYDYVRRSKFLSIYNL